jgi:hypothetical protein
MYVYITALYIFVRTLLVCSDILCAEEVPRFFTSNQPLSTCMSLFLGFYSARLLISPNVNGPPRYHHHTDCTFVSVCLSSLSPVLSTVRTFSHTTSLTLLHVLSHAFFHDIIRPRHTQKRLPTDNRLRTSYMLYLLPCPPLKSTHAPKSF